MPLNWRRISAGCLAVSIVEGFLVRTHSNLFRHTSSVEIPRPHGRSSPLLKAFSLTTALESVAEDNEKARFLLQWMSISKDPQHGMDYKSASRNDGGPTNGQDERRMPIYPLSATYLPTGNHTLRNTEPRNIKMAQDLKEGGRFCVVLSAMDTGRIATVGTVFRILTMNPEYAGDKLKRIVLTCQAEETVDIVEIENPEAASWESRLRRSSEYLVAKIRPKKRNSEKPVESKLVQEIVNDYMVVRDLYRNGIGTNELPPFSREKMSESLPILKEDDFASTEASWKAAQEWQTICYTVREGRKIALVSDRNELMVSAALRKGGALKLPVHMEDLEPEDRKEVQALEVHSQDNWKNLHLDPCIDFQVLLALDMHADRVEHLGVMIKRERLRLEQVAEETRTEMNPPAGTCDTDEEPVEPPRKGAWFDDDCW